jgi:exodeoxyribonuclease VII small subunit
MNSAPQAPATPAPDFEAAMQELEALVAELERGELPLEESLKAFERGIALTRACQRSLKDAEQKVEVLLRESGAGAELAPFEAPEDRAAGEGPVE